VVAASDEAVGVCVNGGQWVEAQCRMRCWRGGCERYRVVAVWDGVFEGGVDSQVRVPVVCGLRFMGGCRRRGFRIRVRRGGGSVRRRQS
jgi:hypothetical protein